MPDESDAGDEAEYGGSDAGGYEAEYGGSDAGGYETEYGDTSTTEFGYAEEPAYQSETEGTEYPTEPVYDQSADEVEVDLSGLIGLLEWLGSADDGALLAEGSIESCIDQLSSWLAYLPQPES